MGGAGGAGGAANRARPNVLLVLLDDLGYSDLAPYGGEIRTPTMDALAAAGTRFRNFYVTPRCSPTRMSLLTGLYTQQVATEAGEPLPRLRTDNNVTLPEVLSKAGYRTYMAGKWQLGTEAMQLPRSRGFDHVFGYDVADPSKWDKTLYHLDSKGGAIAKRTYGNGPRDFYQSTAIGDYALDYLEHHLAENDGAPFFMFLSFNAPHFPIQADRALIENAPAGGGASYLDLYGAGWNAVRTQRYERMLDHGVIDARFGLSPREAFDTPTSTIPNWSTLEDVRKADLTRKMALYAATVEGVDTTVGRVVKQLEATGQLDNTLILVLSDNGGNYEGGVFGGAFKKPDPLTGSDLAQMGQPGHEDRIQAGGGWANVQNTPFRLFKHYTHGGGVRSPLLVSWPAHTAMPGAWTDQVAHVIDLEPTILSAAQAQQPSMFAGHAVLPPEGISLVSTISQAAPPTPRQLGFEHETNRAWIDGDMKLVVRHENADKPELYDLAADPSELDDLSAAQPQRVKTMRDAWNAWAMRVGVPADRKLGP